MLLTLVQELSKLTQVQPVAALATDGLMRPGQARNILALGHERLAGGVPLQVA